MLVSERIHSPQPIYRKLKKQNLLVIIIIIIYITLIYTNVSEKLEESIIP